MLLTPFKQTPVEVFTHTTKNTITMVIPLDIVYSNVVNTLRNADVIFNCDNNILVINTANINHPSIFSEDLYSWLAENQIAANSCFPVAVNYVVPRHDNYRSENIIGAYAKDDEGYHYEIIHGDSETNTVYMRHLYSLRKEDHDIFFMILPNNEAPDEAPNEAPDEAPVSPTIVMHPKPITKVSTKGLG